MRTVLWAGLTVMTSVVAGAERPNILFAIADDWGKHASIYGTPVVQTPTFDRLAREGVVFEHAFVSSPSCTPSRGAILMGQWHWRLGAAGNLHSVFPDAFVTYPDRLQQAGYFVGCANKTWGPGRPETAGRELAGKRFPTFTEFLKARPAGQPFCFWLGSADPHRPFEKGAGAKAGMDLTKIKVPAHYPDNDLTCGDVADYFFEVQRFDRLVGDAVAALEAAGELDRTLIVMSSDHGMPFPHGKSNLYDQGTQVPLAIRWGSKVNGGRTVLDFVSLTDLAPTFLEAAGVTIPTETTGRSLVKLLQGRKAGWIEPTRDHVLVGKERHVPSQEAPDLGGYPCRAIRTKDFMYIRNFRPDRWPVGTPDHKHAAIPGAWYADTDNGPTKTYLVENKEKDDVHRRAYQLSFAKRPAEELYVLASDPEQMVNVADKPEFAATKGDLWKRLETELRATQDPRVIGGGEAFDAHPYPGGAPKHPTIEPEGGAPPAKKKAAKKEA